jgi:hypothetical protein
VLAMTPIDMAFQAAVPPGYTKMQGGGFDIDTLAFEFPVWKPDDHYRRPTGGNIYLRFRLEEGKLVLEERRYEPNPKAQ